jgi:hypothetical protein
VDRRDVDRDLVEAGNRIGPLAELQDLRAAEAGDR